MNTKLPSPESLRALADNEELLYNVARYAVEDVLVEMRDSRIGLLGRNNGLVIREENGADSSIIRLTIESAFAIGLRALADHAELA